MRKELEALLHGNRESYDAAMRMADKDKDAAANGLNAKLAARKKA